MDLDKLSWLKASEYRQNILIALNGKPRTPKDVAEDTDYYLSHVSNTISDLRERGLVECLSSNRRKGRLYSTTDEGEKFVNFLEE